MRGGGEDCKMPTVSDPFSSKSWQNGFKQIGCYWKQQDVKGLIPKPGGLNIANSINNALNYSSATVNDVYEATDAKNKEVSAKMDGIVANIRAWGEDPVTGGKKKVKSKSKTKTKAKTNPKAKSKKMRGGGGSDWIASVRSRGPVNSPDSYWGVPGEMWNQQFQKSGSYIANSELAKGSYQLQTASSSAPKVPSGYDANAFYQSVV